MLDKISIIKNLFVPAEVDSGKYLFSAHARYNRVETVATDNFYVDTIRKPRPIMDRTGFLYLLLALLVIVLTILFFVKERREHIEKSRSRVKIE